MESLYFHTGGEVIKDGNVASQAGVNMANGVVWCLRVLISRLEPSSGGNSDHRLGQDGRFTEYQQG